MSSPPRKRARPPGADVASLIECKVCLEALVDPVALDCMHSFCLKCVAALAGGRRSVVCPVCRKRSDIAHRPLDRRVNYELRDIVDALRPSLAANSDGEAKGEVVDLTSSQGDSTGPLSPVASAAAAAAVASPADSDDDRGGDGDPTPPAATPDPSGWGAYGVAQDGRRCLHCACRVYLDALAGLQSHPMMLMKNLSLTTTATTTAATGMTSWCVPALSGSCRGLSVSLAIVTARVGSSLFPVLEVTSPPHSGLRRALARAVPPELPAAWWEKRWSDARDVNQFVIFLARPLLGLLRDLGVSGCENCPSVHSPRAVSLLKMLQPEWLAPHSGGGGADAHPVVLSGASPLGIWVYCASDGIVEQVLRAMHATMWSRDHAGHVFRRSAFLEVLAALRASGYGIPPALAGPLDCGLSGDWFRSNANPLVRQGSLPIACAAWHCRHCPGETIPACPSCGGASGDLARPPAPTPNRRAAASSPLSPSQRERIERNRRAALERRQRAQQQQRQQQHPTEP